MYKKATPYKFPDYNALRFETDHDHHAKIQPMKERILGCGRQHRTITSPGPSPLRDCPWPRSKCHAHKRRIPERENCGPLPWLLCNVHFSCLDAKFIKTEEERTETEREGGRKGLALVGQIHKTESTTSPSCSTSALLRRDKPGAFKVTSIT